MSVVRYVKKGCYYLVMTVLLLLFIFPFFLVLVNSFKPNSDIVENSLSLPHELYFQGYIQAFDSMNYVHSFLNSLYVTLTSVAVIILLSALCAYFFARKEWKINKIIFTCMVASMIIPFQTIMIPLVKNFSAMHLMNSLNSVILFYIGANVPMAVFMFHGFIKNIPIELEEASTIDGCTKFGVFFKIVLPLLRPIISTVAILNIIGLWNDFMLPFIMIKDQDLRTLPLTTYSFVGQYTADYSLITSGLVLTIIPIIIAYVFLQKHIIEGVVQGAIK